MVLVSRSEAIRHDMHGSVFTSFIAPSTGSEQLCAWQLDVPPNAAGVPHRVSHEEVLLILAGELVTHVDDVPVTARAGDAVCVPAGARFCVDGGPSGASAWVVTRVGLTATTSDGTRIVPPWTR